MKQVSFLQVVVLAALMVTAVSCGMPMGATGDYYEEAPTSGYYGGAHTIIVERDPYTGRYYQVSPGLYGRTTYGSRAYPYNRRPVANRRYNNNSNRNFNNQNSGYYKTYPQAQQPRQTPAQREQIRQEREQTKESILRKKRN